MKTQNTANCKYFCQEALRNKNLFLLGNFNYHYIGETAYIYDLGLCDLWLEHKGKGDAGYTFDPQLNPMMPLYLIFEERRMRLDRIVMQQESKMLRP